MTDVEIAALSVFANAGVDRLRGSGNSYVKADWYGSVLFAFIIGILFNIPSWGVVWVALAYKLGESPGWGCPLGASLNGTPMSGERESWQKGILADHVELAMLFRGLMWAAPVAAVLSVYDTTLGVIALLSMTLNFVATPYMVRKVQNGYLRWKYMEELRGGLTMLPVAIYSLV